MKLLTDFMSAASDYKQSLRIISENKLWRYVLVPGLISVSVIGFAYGLCLWFFNSDRLANIIETIFPSWLSWIESFSLWLVDLLSAGVVVTVVFVAAMFVAGKYLVLAIAGPFMGTLSQKVEAIVYGQATESPMSFTQGLARAAKVSARSLAKELCFTLLILPLNIVPVIGSAAATFLGLSVACYYSGFGSMDPVLERKNLDAAASLKYARQNRAATMGNGSVFLAILAVPIVGWFLAPALATVAATLTVLNQASPTATVST